MFLIKNNQKLIKKENNMSEQNAVNEKTRAQEAQERYMQKQNSAKQKKTIKPFPFLIAGLALVAVLAIGFGIYIANMHIKLSGEDANADLATMTQIDTIDMSSLVKNAPWAFIYCYDGDFVVNSSRTYASDSLRNCSYKLAPEVQIEIVSNIWSTRGKIRFTIPVSAD